MAKYMHRLPSIEYVVRPLRRVVTADGITQTSAPALRAKFHHNEFDSEQASVLLNWTPAEQALVDNHLQHHSDFGKTMWLLEDAPNLSSAGTAVELAREYCRWVDVTGDATAEACGKRAWEHSDYCREHTAKALLAEEETAETGPKTARERRPQGVSADA